MDLHLACGKRAFLAAIETDEQVRGVSAFSKGIELFRNLSDAISYELFAQVIAASFPVFVALENGGVQLPDYVTEGREGDGERRERQLVQDLSPGQFLYGNENEKPYVLESKRPSANFSAFVEIVLRATAASVGIPYESLTKDFSKTNYSSARAALNEAWKLYSFYRNWFGRLYCQPVYEMVIEEAFLRGMFELPKGAPGFYEARKFWCNVDWIGPSRGFVDPVKEITATILALQNRLMTYGEAWAETGRDFDEGYARMLDESPLLALLGPLSLSTKLGKAGKDAAPEGDENGPLQLLVSSIDYNEFVGRMAIGRIERGALDLLGAEHGAQQRFLKRIRCDGRERVLRADLRVYVPQLAVLEPHAAG